MRPHLSRLACRYERTDISDKRFDLWAPSAARSPCSLRRVRGVTEAQWAVASGLKRQAWR
jgi:hypothetical protein